MYIKKGWERQPDFNGMSRALMEYRAEQMFAHAHPALYQNRAAFIEWLWNLAGRLKTYTGLPLFMVYQEESGDAVFFCGILEKDELQFDNTKKRFVLPITGGISCSGTLILPWTDYCLEPGATPTICVGGEEIDGYLECTASLEKTRAYERLLGRLQASQQVTA